MEHWIDTRREINTVVTPQHYLPRPNSRKDTYTGTEIPSMDGYNKADAALKDLNRQLMKRCA